MSDQIAVSHVQQYRNNVYMLAQQKGSKLRMCVRDDGKIIGKRVFFDRIGATTAQKKTTRHGDTPLMNTPHSRRSGILDPYQWADLIDKSDLVRMLIDPTSSYTINGSNAMGRSMDDAIIAALYGTAYEGESGETPVTFPAAQIIVDANVGLDLAKVVTAKEKLNAADIDKDEKLYFVYGPKQLTNVLQIAQFTSADYNTVKALVAGEIASFMGFEWIMSTRLPIDANDIRKTFAFAQSGMGMLVGEDITVDVGIRRDKSNSNQVYIEMDIGAIRVEDVKVVEIDCDETPD